ncbi:MULTISPECIES: hypothetical protein [Bacillus]|nr:MULTISPECIES: hypothetical protein [Bacillus]
MRLGFGNIRNKLRIMNKMDKQERMNKKLIEKLEPYIFEYEYGIDNVEEYRSNNKKAKEFLSIFYKELQKIPLAKKYDNGGFHTNYISYLLRIRQFFEEKRYTSVCNELQSLIYHQPINQPRIYYNILSLLEFYLELEEIKWTKEELLFQLASNAHKARNKDHLDNIMLRMLSIMVKGTPYETDVAKAFDVRRDYDELERKGRSQLIMNLFEVGKKYEIETFIKRRGDNEYFKCKCYVKEKTYESLAITVFEPSNVGEYLIEWEDVAAVKEIE